MMKPPNQSQSLSRKGNLPKLAYLKLFLPLGQVPTLLSHPPTSLFDPPAVLLCHPPPLALAAAPAPAEQLQLALSRLPPPHPLSRGRQLPLPALTWSRGARMKNLLRPNLKQPQPRLLKPTLF